MEKLRAVYQRGRNIWGFLRPMEIPLHASHTGFFLVLSVFPALMLFLGLLRYTDLGVQELMDLLSGWIPTSLMPTAESLVEASYRHSSGMLFSLSVVTALWSASKGTHGLLRGLDAVRGITRRPYWRSRGLSMIYTFLFLVALILTLVVHVFGNALLDYLWMTTFTPLTTLLEMVDLRFVLLLLLQTVLFTAMYALPSGQRRLEHCLPGAILASLGWTVCSRLFSVYVTYFATYTNVFGSIYVLALGMLWLYFCICILFYGAAFNRYRKEKNQAE